MRHEKVSLWATFLGAAAAATGLGLMYTLGTMAIQAWQIRQELSGLTRFETEPIPRYMDAAGLLAADLYLSTTSNEKPSLVFIQGSEHCVQCSQAWELWNEVYDAEFVDRRPTAWIVEFGESASPNVSSGRMVSHFLNPRDVSIYIARTGVRYVPAAFVLSDSSVACAVSGIPTREFATDCVRRSQGVDTPQTIFARNTDARELLISVLPDTIRSTVTVNDSLATTSPLQR